MTFEMASQIGAIEEIVKTEYKLEDLSEKFNDNSVCFTDALDALDKCIIVLATELVNSSKKDTVFEKGTF